jgi:hypothetical protein
VKSLEINLDMLFQQLQNSKLSLKYVAELGKVTERHTVVWRFSNRANARFAETIGQRVMRIAGYHDLNDNTDPTVTIANSMKETDVYFIDFYVEF